MHIRIHGLCAVWICTDVHNRDDQNSYSNIFPPIEQTKAPTQRKNKHNKHNKKKVNNLNAQHNT